MRAAVVFISLNPQSSSLIPPAVIHLCGELVADVEGLTGRILPPADLDELLDVGDFLGHGGQPGERVGIGWSVDVAGVEEGGCLALT